MRVNLPVIFVFITVTIDSMGIGLIIPVMPDLLREIDGGSLARAAVWGGVLSTSFAVMQFLFGPILGRLSDAFGRRPVLMVSLAVMAIDYLVMSVAHTLWILLAARILGGITAATHSTAMAFMADISTAEEKAKRFGLIGAAFGAGFVLGPLLGGLLAEYGTRAPFLLAAALTAANLLFGLLVLPETLPHEKRRAFTWSGLNPFASFKGIATLPSVRPLTIVYFLFQLSTYVYPAIWAYFTLERFGWSPGMVGLSLAIYGCCIAIVQGGLVGPVIKRLGEGPTVILGLGIEIFSMVMLGFLSSGIIALMLIPVMAFGAVGNPPLQSFLSRAVPDDQQGELQGVLTSVSSLSMIIAPLAMTQIFAAFSKDDSPIYLPGAPFLFAAVLMVGAWLIFMRYMRNHMPQAAASNANPTP